MTNNFVLLNNVEHQNTRIITDRSAEYGDDVSFALTFPFEFRAVQSSYPIFLRKDNNTGKFFPVALFGFQPKENLYLEDGKWNAAYIPLMIRRHPFLIGMQQSQNQAEDSQPVVSIDMNSPRVNEEHGERLFLEHGGTSDYLASMIELLESIQHGHEMNTEFVDALLALDLVESVSLEVGLKDGSRNQLAGFYTVNEERLGQLEGEALWKLHERSFLQATYMILASLSRFRSLIDKKNDRLDVT